MTDQPEATVTALLLSWRNGDKTALDRLVPIVYGELRRVARARLKAERGHSLEPTALVHEVYLRLLDLDRMTVHDRTHFFALAARLMRQVLVDRARRRQAQKRGGGVPMVSVDEASPLSRTSVVDVLALDQALQELAAFDERSCQIVELRYFAGLNIDETAEAMEISTATVEREWSIAKAWLLKRLSA